MVEVYRDAGISGAKGRDQRPGLDAMLKDAGRWKFDIVMARAIDRLGRSLIDLLRTIQDLEAVGVDLYLDQQHLDTTTPTGKRHFTTKAVLCAGALVDQVRRPTQIERARQELAKGVGLGKVAHLTGLGTGTVHKLKREMAASMGA